MSKEVLIAAVWMLATLARFGRPQPDQSDVPLQRGVRIVHGEDARDGEYLYQASIQPRMANGKYGYCGGAFIRPNYVITAGHCCSSRKPGELAVVGGVKNLQEDQSVPLPVVEILRFNYNHTTKVNDFSILRVDTAPLKKKVVRIMPIDVCPKTFDPSGKNGTVSGWGMPFHHSQASLHKNENFTHILQSAKIKIRSPKECKEMYKNKTEIFQPKYMICAGGSEKDACQGDSGGPLAAEQDDGAKCLVGTVSWGIGCAKPGIPGCYTNLRNYKAAIDEAIKNATKRAESKSENVRGKKGQRS